MYLVVDRLTWSDFPIQQFGKPLENSATLYYIINDDIFIRIYDSKVGQVGLAGPNYTRLVRRATTPDF